MPPHLQVPAAAARRLPLPLLLLLLLPLLLEAWCALYAALCNTSVLAGSRRAALGHILQMLATPSRGYYTVLDSVIVRMLLQPLPITRTMGLPRATMHALNAGQAALRDDHCSCWWANPVCCNGALQEHDG